MEVSGGRIVFSEETAIALIGLGHILKKIHARLQSEGYSIIDGQLTKNADESE
jgi:hypothetical protein